MRANLLHSRLITGHLGRTANFNGNLSTRCPTCARYAQIAFDLIDRLIGLDVFFFPCSQQFSTF